LIFPLFIELQPSRLLCACVSLIHVLALTGCWAGLSAGPLLLTTLGLAVSACYHLALACQRLPLSVFALEIAEDGALTWRDRNGNRHSATLGHDTYATTWVIVMPLADTSGHTRYLTLLPDSAPAEQLRRLRVWLRWSRHGADSGHAA
jgi:hypothetical protein